jgi:hypothetical protein
MTTGLGGLGNSTGKTLKGIRLPPNRIIDSGNNERKFPVASRKSFNRGERDETVTRGVPAPAARNACAINDSERMP